MSVAGLSTDIGRQASLTPCDMANLWRGQFIQEFVLAERVVSEALVWLAGIATSGAKSLLPHLPGQQFAALRAVVADDGPFAITGGAVAGILREFDEFHHLRAYVCHGSITVTQERYGGWYMTLDLLAFRGQAAEHTVWQLPQKEADTVLESLRSARLRLDGHVRGMRAGWR